ncbi:hypothetical protein JVU11DRAFT_10021 [Chiua virens]|nr:hypothetical protein JVU11DRAFT_10021 [Chiua virens]
MPSIPGSPARFFHAHGRSHSPQPSSSVISLLRNPSPFFKSAPSLLNASPSHHGTPHRDRARTKLFHRNRKSKERASSEPLEDWEVLERTGFGESGIDDSLPPPSPATPQDTAMRQLHKLKETDCKLNNGRARPASPSFVARHVRRHTTSSRGSQMSALSAPVSPISVTSTATFNTPDISFSENTTASEDVPAAIEVRFLRGPLAPETEVAILLCPPELFPELSESRRLRGLPRPMILILISLSYLIIQYSVLYLRALAPSALSVRPTSGTISPSLIWILDKGVTRVVPYLKPTVSTTPSTPPIPEGLLIDLDDDSLDTPSQPTPNPTTPPCEDILGLDDDNGDDNDNMSVSPPGPLTPTTSGFASASSLTLSTTASRSVESLDASMQTTPTSDVPDINGLVSSLGDQGMSDGSNYDTFLGLPRRRHHFQPPCLCYLESDPDSVDLEPVNQLDTSYLVGNVELVRRRVTKDGRVKLKMSLLGVAVEKCAICMTQFKADDAGILGATCQHACVSFDVDLDTVFGSDVVH